MRSPRAWDDCLSKQQDLVGAEMTVHVGTGRRRARLPPWSIWWPWGHLEGVSIGIPRISWGAVPLEAVWDGGAACRMDSR